MENTSAGALSTGAIIKELPRTTMRGVGQVMFQDNAWTGLLFMIGIFWGAYASGTPAVAWGALVGVVVSTITGYLIGLKDEDGAQGLWGFNGVLVGCAFPTFMGDTVWMWLALIFCSAVTTWVRTAFNAIFARYNVTSYTFPFVFCTWLFLLAAKEMNGIPASFESHPEIAYTVDAGLKMGFGDLVIYWLKGISQVFLINSWVTGIFFLAALAVSSWRAALWAALGSAIALFISIVFQASGASIEGGLYGFSAVLTAIALGATFMKPGWKCTLWTIAGTILTVFVQAGMNAFMAPLGIATLTGPFCVATWLMLMPQYRWFNN